MPPKDPPELIRVERKEYLRPAATKELPIRVHSLGKDGFEIALYVSPEVSRTPKFARLVGLANSYPDDDVVAAYLAET